MPALSGVTMDFTDGNLGVAVPGPGGAQANIGVSLGGTELEPVSLGNTTTVGQTLLGGPLCDCCAQLTSAAGVPAIAVPCAIITAGAIASLAGSAGAFTHTGTGTGTVTATIAPHQIVKAKCVTGGTLSTATFQFSVNNGAYGTIFTSTATSWPKRVPGTFCVLTFAAATYRAADVYTFNTDGTVDRTAGAPDTVTAASSPVDAYDVLVTITTAGARGTAQFTVSLDGGAVTETTIVTAATYVVPGTGIVLAFTGTSDAYVVDDTYEALCTPPATNNTQIGLALDALQASSLQWEIAHVVGTPANAADAATLATAVDLKMTAMALVNKFKAIVTECPGKTNTVDTDAVVAAAFVSVSSAKGRVWVALDWCDLISPLTGLTLKRSVAWPFCARTGATRLCESPGKVKLGGVKNVRAIYRDEQANPGMVAARFICLRTRDGKPGFFFERHPTMAPAGSDYSRSMNVRVINLAATIAAAAYVEEVANDLRADKTTGFIDERDAQRIDANVTGQLRAQMIGSPGTANDQCSDVTSQVGRADNISSTETMTAIVQVLPKNYPSYISCSIGFVNPALQAA